MEPKMQHFDVLIVGGGHGGAQAAIALRQAKFGGSVAILGAEPDLPYERPPLSKEYLAGEKPYARLLIRPLSFWQERDVTMLPARRVTAIDSAAHSVTTAGGEQFGYGKLIWAAGGNPRRLTCEGHDLIGVHTVRTREDADRMMDELPHVTQAVVIGGGYIGLEAAAVLTKLGKQVVLLEALDRLLARVAGPELSDFFAAEHRAHGVDVRLGTTAISIEGSERHVSHVRLGDGSLVPAQMVVVGIGIMPSVEPLLKAGAKGGNGVAVDAQCRTSLPDIYAVGDCALHANRFADGAAVRIESVQNANDQASTAAKSIVGETASYDAIPWFWSNQYDLRLQTVGLSAGHDDTVVRGDPSSRSFSIVYLKRGRVIALDCVNMVKDYVQGRKLILDKAMLPPERLADTSVQLKDIG